MALVKSRETRGNEKLEKMSLHSQFFFAKSDFGQIEITKKNLLT